MTIEEIKKYNEKKVEEIIEADKIRKLKAQKTFEKRIDKEWEKHVKKCVKTDNVITQDFSMKVKGYRLPYYMEESDYSYTNDAGTFRIHFVGSERYWFRTVYYYVVQNMNIAWN